MTTGLVRVELRSGFHSMTSYLSRVPLFDVRPGHGSAV